MIARTLAAWWRLLGRDGETLDAHDLDAHYR